MRLPLAIDESAHFACNGCTTCCDQPWRTMIEADKAAAIDAHDFTKFPQLTGKRFYHPPADGREGFFDLAKGEGTRCLFLHSDGRCIIHMEMGPQAKPGMCLQFPYLPAVTWTQQRVSLNFGCPSVQKKSGPPLTTQRDAIEATVPPTRREPKPRAATPLNHSILLQADEADAVLDRAIHLFGDSWDGDPWRRFSRLLSLCFAVGQFKLIESPNDSAGGALTEMLRSGVDLPQTPPAPDIQSFPNVAAAPIGARMLFAATLFPDTLPADASPRMGFARRLSLVPRLFSLARLSGAYASRVLGRNVAIDAVLHHDVGISLDEESTALLLRYFRARFWQRLMAGGSLPIVSGLHQHIHDFNAIVFLARAEALHVGSDRLSAALIRQALTRVEFHVANQPRLHSQVLKGWMRNQLADVSLAIASLRLMALRRATAAALQPADLL